GTRAAVTLVESGGGLQPPGGSVTLVCRASGFPFGNSPMEWLRQAAGKEPEWLAGIDAAGGSPTYAPRVRGRSVISRDNSRNTVTLRMSRLRNDDGATYYCAKAAH
ncbi:HV323 protein, partial [Pluvianellus socialis]|nr:HV323 protein [Pluvianellus socialis]